MRKVRPVLGAWVGVVLAGVAGPDAAIANQRRPQQEEAQWQHAAGRLLPLREIEKRVLPTMGNAEYIGSDFNAETGIYTLKFLRRSRVIWVDVDGRTGRIVRITE